MTSVIPIALENSRGVCHAKQLFGADTDQPFTGVRISDGYAAYRALPGQQQHCWARLYRAIRDLRYNDNLPEERLPYVTWWYESFAAIYQDLRLLLEEPYDNVVREQQAAAPGPGSTALLPANQTEPTKLAPLKARLARPARTSCSCA
jgi:hypothetical protein